MKKNEVLPEDIRSMAAQIVAAFVSGNKVSADGLPKLIEAVYRSLEDLEKGGEAKPEPAVPVRQSVKRNHIVCLEDGKKFKILKRHLRTFHSMTQAEYRAKWGLRQDYPMVAPSYAAKRSELAKAAGLGRGRKRVSRKPHKKAVLKKAA